MLLDIGYKSEGVIPSRELSIRNDVDPNEVVSLDEELEALVLQKEDKDGRLILSKKRAQYERAWGTIETLKEKDEVVVRPGHRGRQGRPHPRHRPARASCPRRSSTCAGSVTSHPFVGRTLECKIIELDKNRNNVVLSRRAYLEETQREQRDEFLTNLKPGEIRQGVVSSVVNFGAFVDLGGMDGLVHVSELSWKHVDHPSSVVQVGDEVTVQVLDVDLVAGADLAVAQGDPAGPVAGVRRPATRSASSSTAGSPSWCRSAPSSRWARASRVSSTSPRWPAHHVEAPEQVVTPGEELWVKIIDIDLDRRRISLSIKQAAEGGVVAAEYQDQFGEHNYDEHGNYIGPAIEVEAEEDAGRRGHRPADDEADDDAPRIPIQGLAESDLSAPEADREPGRRRPSA